MINLTRKNYPRLYQTWLDMKSRCYNPNKHEYENYGGRGIIVCDEWKYDFRCFAQWAIDNGYRDNLTLDRVDNEKGYEPKNCRFVTMKVQQRNRRGKKYSTSNVKGVSWDKNRNKWRASICVDYKQINLGYFSKQSDAAQARKEAEKKYW